MDFFDFLKLMQKVKIFHCYSKKKCILTNVVHAAASGGGDSTVACTSEFRVKKSFVRGAEKFGGLKNCLYLCLWKPMDSPKVLNPFSMKLTEYFDNLPIGEVVNKRGLAYLKRMGYIWDYSEFGYLESVPISGKKERDGYRAEDFRHLFPFGNAKVVEGYDNAMYEKYRQKSAWNESLSREDMYNLFGVEREFEFKGNKFGLKYFDGCFSPYLVKTGSAKVVSEVNHRMAFPFGVV